MIKDHCSRKNKKKIKTYKFDNFIVKARLIPWYRKGRQVSWLFSFGCGKTARQVNDWLDIRKNKRARSLKNNMTGKKGLIPHVFAIKALKQWQKEISQGDSIIFMCESIKRNKQFKIYRKWFMKHEKGWIIDNEIYAFIYLKH